MDFVGARNELEQKERPVVDKRLTANAAVSRYVEPGDHIAIGGTLYSRTPMSLVFAVLRQGIGNLKMSRPLTCYEAELLMATGQLDRIVTSWVGIGLQLGLARVVREYVESRRVEYEEWSHLAIGLRYKAGAMGVPYLPCLSMLGSSLADAVDLKTVICPYTGQRLAAVPALIPDVALIHAHRADMYGNIQVDGYRHMDVDMARAARKVIVSAERIVSPEEIQRRPVSTVLPHFVVDAVVEAPFGAYPGECYGLYEAHMAHFDSYVGAVRDRGSDGAREYVKRYVDGHADFSSFLLEVGEATLDRLKVNAEGLMP